MNVLVPLSWSILEPSLTSLSSFKLFKVCISFFKSFIYTFQLSLNVRKVQDIYHVYDLSHQLTQSQDKKYYSLATECKKANNEYFFKNKKCTYAKI
jgi:hypothetical protein